MLLRVPRLVAVCFLKISNPMMVGDVPLMISCAKQIGQSSFSNKKGGCGLQNLRDFFRDLKHDDVSGCGIGQTRSSINVFVCLSCVIYLCQL